MISQYQPPSVPHPSQPTSVSRVNGLVLVEVVVLVLVEVRLDSGNII